MLSSERATFILGAWERQHRPVLWVEPDAVISRAPSLLAAIDCDFAVHKWNRWEMTPRTLYFGRSAAAEAMLRTWHRFASSYPTVWSGYTIDQAWSGVTSQIPLDTVWLPRAYHMAVEDQGSRKAPVITHDFETTTADLGRTRYFRTSTALRAAPAGSAHRNPSWC